MELLLIVPRDKITSEVNYNYAFPMGLAYISATLKKEGYPVDILNTNHFEGLLEEVIGKALDSKKYDYVLTGGNSLACGTIRQVINICKEHYSRPKLILGGPIITSEPELMFNSLKPDFAVIGEGEKTILELLDHIENKKNLNEVKGISFWDNGKMVQTPKRDVIEDLDSIPFYDLEGFEFEKLLENKHTNSDFTTNSLDFPRPLSLLASRSCPFSCTFCYHDGKYRKRSVDNVMEELKTNVKRYKINLIVMNDECFALDKERLYELCRRIKELNEELPWDLKWVCQFRAKMSDPESLKMMKEAGCEMVGYGFESYSPIVLKSMKKFSTPEEIDQAIKETLKAKIALRGNFIFGDIAETKETAKTTLDYWKKHCNGQVMLNFVRPYPGSEIYRYCLEKGIIKDKLHFIENEMASSFPPTNMTSMTDEEFKKLKRDIFEAKSKYCKFVKPDNMKKIKENVYALKVRCPYCKEINHYKNCLISPNKYMYSIEIRCRECNMSYYIVSSILKMAYKNYEKIRPWHDYYTKISARFNKKKLYA